MSSDTVASVTSCQEPQRANFYVVSIKKLICMTLFTAGLYAFYWFYRNWANYKNATGDDVVPFLRSIVPVFFIYPLLKRIDQRLKQVGIQHDWSPGTLGMAMWLIVALSVGSGFLTPEPTGELTHDALLSLRFTVEVVLQLVASLWVMCKIQQAINVLESDPQGESNADFSGANKGWMAFGIAIWVLNFTGLWLLLLVAYP